MYAYSPFKRRSSSASKPAQSPPALAVPPRPIYSSAISESPIAGAGSVGAGQLDSPYPPPTARDGLLPISTGSGPRPLDSHGSGAPLLPRFSTELTPPDELRDDGSSFNLYPDSPVTLPIPTPLPPKQQTTPLRMPPPGIHDPYVSRFLSPLDSPGVPGAARPAPLIRSSSMPGVAPRELGDSLLPTSPGAGEEEDVEGKLIFEVFDAQFEHGADNMAKILKGHLAEVLKMQEEVGKMHLGLEGLRAPPAAGGAGAPEGGQAQGAAEAEGEDKAVEKREQGVEEIMQRLGSLSDELRKYHSLGTPKLSFPKQGDKAGQGKGADVKPTPTTTSPRRNPMSPKRSAEAIIPRAQSNLDKLTAGLNIDIPDSLRSSYPEYTVLGSPPDMRRSERPPASKTKPTSPVEGGNLAQQAAKRSLAQAWDKDHADQKDTAESVFVENMRKDLD